MLSIVDDKYLPPFILIEQTDIFDPKFIVRILFACVTIQ